MFYSYYRIIWLLIAGITLLGGSFGERLTFPWDGAKARVVHPPGSLQPSPSWAAVKSTSTPAATEPAVLPATVNAGVVITSTATAFLPDPPTPVSPTPTPELTPTPTPRPTRQPIQAGPVYLPVIHYPIPYTEMVVIPAGKFLMGCDPSNDICNYKQAPLHRVVLGSYAIDKYEVTNLRYQMCVLAGACTPPKTIASFTQPWYYTNPQFAHHPVMSVDWYQAAAYCSWAGRRLPTEAEWEKAARGDSDTRPYPWGNQAPDCARTNFLNINDFCVGDTVRVGSYPDGASPYGVMDMAGNAWEWVADWFGDTYYSTFPFKGWPDNPLGPTTGTDRVIRSGAWDLDQRGIRTSRRQWGIPDGYDTSTGFRCAKSLD